MLLACGGGGGGADGLDAPLPPRYCAGLGKARFEQVGPFSEASVQQLLHSGKPDQTMTWLRFLLLTEGGTRCWGEHRKLSIHSITDITVTRN